MSSKVRQFLSKTIIMSADTRAELNGFKQDINVIKANNNEIKTMINELSCKIDAHIRDEGFDIATVKAHLAEAIELMKQIDR
jgi:glycerol-3-phosphate cytidylyltransferase-like family protein